MVVPDTAAAGYVDDEEKKRAAYDGQGAELELAAIAQEEYPPAPMCAQCVNWQAARQLMLANGTNQRSPGFCTTRAAADMMQMPQDYAVECLFFAEEIPF